MKFRVVGCDSRTGEGVDIVLEAPDLAWAQHIARHRGIAVDSIDPVAPGARPAPKPARPVPAPPRPPKAPPEPAAPAAEDAEAAPDMVDFAEPDLGEPPPSAEHAIPAPPLPGTPRGRVSLKMPAIPRRVAVGLAILIVLGGGAWALWTLVLARGGGMAAYLAFTPAGADTLTLADLRAIRNTDLYGLMRGIVEQAMGREKATSLSLDRIDSIFIAGRVSADRPDAVVLTTAGDVTLADVISGGKPLVVEGFDCVVGPGGRDYAARTRRGKFLVCPDAETLRRVLQQYRDGSAVSLSADMERALKLTGHWDITIVSSARQDHGAFSATGSGMSPGDTISMIHVMIAANPADAAKVVDAIAETKNRVRSGSAKLPPELGSAVRLIEGIDARTNGNAVVIRGRWKYADLKPIFQQISSLADLFGRMRPARP